jgi:hypothetical protein
MDLDYDEASPTFCMLKNSTDAKPFIYAPVKLDNLAVDTAPYESMGLAEITLLLDTTNKLDKNYIVLYTVYLLKLSDTLSSLINSNQEISYH